MCGQLVFFRAIICYAWFHGRDGGLTLCGVWCSQIEELTKKALLVEYGDPRAEEAGEEDEELPPLEDEGFPEEQGAATAA